jgi:O-antigen ligase
VYVLAMRHSKNTTGQQVTAAALPWSRSFLLLGWALVVLHLALSPLLFSSHTLETFEYPKAQLLLLAALLLGAIGLSAAIEQVSVKDLKQRCLSWLRILAGNPMHLGVGLFLVSALLSTIASASPHTSWYGHPESHAGLRTIFAGVALFVATFAVCRSRSAVRWLLGAATAGGAIACAYGWLQYCRLDPIAWERAADLHGHLRPFATLGHANHLAAFLVMTLPIMLYFTWQAATQKRWLIGAVLAIVALGSLAMILITLSRGAWLALAGVAIFGLVMSWRRFSKLRAGGKGIVIAAAVVLAVVFVTQEEVQQRLFNLGHSPARLMVWQASWQIFLDHPILGAGVDTFQLVFPAYRPPGHWEVDGGTTPARAHNLVLQVLATQGVVGMAALLILGFGLVRQGLRAWHLHANQRPLLLAVFASLVGFFVQAQFNFLVIPCGVLLLTLIAVAARLGQAIETPAAEKQPGWLSILAALAGLRKSPRALLLLLLLWVGTAFLIERQLVRPLLANMLCHTTDAVLATRPDLAWFHYQQVVKLDPSQDSYWMRLGVSAQLSAAALSGEQQFDRLKSARNSMTEAVRLVPINSYHRHHLGLVLIDLTKQGRLDAAHGFAELDRAQTLDPGNPRFPGDAANAALEIGDLARVKMYANRALDLPAPPPRCLAQRGYIALREKQYPEAIRLLTAAVQTRWPEPRKGEYTVACLNLASAHLHLQQFEQSRSAAQQALHHAPNLAEARFLLGRSLEGQGRNPEAEQSFREALLFYPRHLGARQGLLRLSKAERGKQAASSQSE